MLTGIKITKTTPEEMLAHPEQAYNPQTWKNRVNDYLKPPKCQFYTRLNGTNSWTEFYVSYVSDGLYFLKEFHAFHSCISNAGFCKVYIMEDGTVGKIMFKGADGKEGYAENCEANRKSFRKCLTPNNVMVSTSF
jgi:hypothetical protein